MNEKWVTRTGNTFQVWPSLAKARKARTGSETIEAVTEHPEPPENALLGQQGALWYALDPVRTFQAARDEAILEMGCLDDYGFEWSEDDLQEAYRRACQAAYQERMAR